MNNELLEQILSYFRFSEIEIIVLSLLVFLLILQLFFYFRYYRKPYNYVTKITETGDIDGSSPLVSVIIVSKNEVESLAENLPFILDQKYPNFEVVVVNDGSTDESHDLLESLRLKHSNLYHTYLPYSRDTQFGRRKLALTIGIKAAKGDILLFTEPYCRPVSDQWITCLTEKISDKTDVVLGYSYFNRNKEFYNRVARFDNQFCAMQYLSKAILEQPFTGTYRNVAFKKQLFYDNKGFSAHLNIENGEDLFINQIVNSNNTEVALTRDSFVETSLTNFSMWRHIKKDYSVTKAHLRKRSTGIFTLEAASRYFFYGVFALLTVYSCILQSWGLMACGVLLFLIRLCVQLTVIGKSARYFNSGIFRFSFILMDIVQPIYNFRFKTHAKGARGKRLRK